MKQKIRKIFQTWKKKKKNYDNLVKLVRTLDKKENYKYYESRGDKDKNYQQNNVLT